MTATLTLVHRQGPTPDKADRNRRADRERRFAAGVICLPHPLLAPEARCYCDGYLVLIDGAWIHLDVCAWCETDSTRCVDADDAHPAMCSRPAPAQCDHCHHDNVIPNECEWGDELCCGCCADHPGHRPARRNADAMGAARGQAGLVTG